MKALIAGGSDKEHEDTWGWTPLMFVHLHNHIYSFNQLVNDMIFDVISSIVLIVKLYQLIHLKPAEPQHGKYRYDCNYVDRYVPGSPIASC